MRNPDPQPVTPPSTPNPRLPRRLAPVLVLLAAVLLVAPSVADACTVVPVPVVLTSPGHYCLDQDHDVNLSTGAAILVESDHVTVDFRGHAIRNHAPRPFTSGYPVGVQADGRSHVAVRNGVVVSFREGISLSGSGETASFAHLVEDMRVIDSQRIGIGVFGQRSVVRRNIVERVTGSNEEDPTGIWMAAGTSRVLDNDVSLVTGAGDKWGIRFLEGLDNVAEDNRLTSTGGGILMEDTRTVYRDNIVLQLPSGRDHYLGGVDAGGNVAN